MSRCQSVADEVKIIKAMSNQTWQKEGYGINMANIATLHDSSPAGSYASIYLNFL